MKLRPRDMAVARPGLTPGVPLQRNSRIADLGNPRAQALLRFWHDCRRPPLVPSRADFEPFKLRSWLGCISIYEAIDGGRDFVVKLDGTEVVGMTDDDWTGRLACDIDAEYDVNVRVELRAVLAGGVPTVRRIDLLQKRWKSATRLCLPVSRGDGRIADQVFMALFIDS